MAVSLRVPDDVKRRIAKLAKSRDTTTHAFMLQAIREKLAAEEARAAFYTEAQRRLARMKKYGRGIAASEVFDYLRDRAKGGKPSRPKPRRIA